MLVSHRVEVEINRFAEDRQGTYNLYCTVGWISGNVKTGLYSYIFNHYQNMPRDIKATKERWRGWSMMRVTTQTYNLP